MPIATEDSYELSYNDAIRLLGEGKLTEAEAQLRQAETLCRKSLEDDGVPEEDIEDELALIKYWSHSTNIKPLPTHLFY